MSLFRVLYRGENHFDFIEGSRKVLMASATIVLISIVALLGRGLNLGIEFEGGVVWEVPSGEATEDDIRNTLTDFGLDGRIHKVTGGTDVFRVRAESATIAQQNDLTAALAETVGVTVNDISRSEVGPSWGDEITNKARTALIWFFILLALYITFRLEWKMAAAALVAVGHDILISVGVYAVFRFEVTPATVIAFLTIMGYSLYDTIVVFDRVKETAGAAEKARTRYTDVVNVSLNQVVMRSINTSITSGLPVLSMLIIGRFVLGAVALQEFAVALLVGILAGTYSSIFVASPILVALKLREPEWARRRELARKSGEVGSVAEAATTLAASSYSRTAPPRPRKKGKKR